jgi:hypothetical protein
MKRYLLLLCLCSIFSIHANAHKSQAIAVYNVDSVLVNMPEYGAALIEYLKFDSVVDLQLGQLETERYRLITEYNNDSAKWSAVIRQIKGKQIEDIGSNIRQFREMAVLELEQRKKALREPLEKKITGAVAVIAKERAFLAVIRNEGYVLSYYSLDVWDTSYTTQSSSLVHEISSQPITYQDPKIKTVNITALLIEKLKKA